MKKKWNLSTDNKVALIGAAITGTCAIIAALLTGATLTGILNISIGNSSRSASPVASAKPSAQTPETSGTGVGGITNPPPAPSGGALLRQGSFTITQGYCIDLDSSAPNWGSSNSCATDATPADIRQIGNVAVDAPNGNNNFSILSRSKGSSLSTCLATTAYIDSIYVSNLHKGLRVCVHTSSGNEALLQVKSVASDDSSVTFAAVVWKA